MCVAWFGLELLIRVSQLLQGIHRILARSLSQYRRVQYSSLVNTGIMISAPETLRLPRPLKYIWQVRQPKKMMHRAMDMINPHARGHPFRIRIPVAIHSGSARCASHTVREQCAFAYMPAACRTCSCDLLSFCLALRRSVISWCSHASPYGP